jgi:phage baseplate assembly protein W
MAQAIGITLPIQIGNMGYFQQAFDTLTQVKSNFINLILTRKGERVHQPEFGCGIHDYLFEQLTPENIEGARLSVVNAVERWMPFLELVQFELNASPNDLDNNRLQLYVGYRLRQNPNIRDTIILTF